jgi:hypothetical protein
MGFMGKNHANGVIARGKKRFGGETKVRGQFLTRMLPAATNGARDAQNFDERIPVAASVLTPSASGIA